MVIKLSLTEEQKRAFDEILYGKNASPLGEKKRKKSKEFDPIKLLMGSGKVASDLMQLTGGNFEENILFICAPSDAKLVLCGLVRVSLQKKKSPAVVLLANNYKTITELLDDEKIGSVPVLVDCVSESIYPVKPKRGVVFVDSIRNLTQIQIAVSELIRKSKSNFFIFDSVDVLFLYHDEQVVLKFISSLIKILDANRCFAVFVSARQNLPSKFVQSFDEKYSLKKYY